MKIDKKLVIVMVICALMGGCESQTKEIEANTIYPMQLGSNEAELLDLLKGPNGTAILSANLEDHLSRVKFFVESYRDGELIGVQDGLVVEIDNTLDIAITSRDVGNWDINVRSMESIVSSNLNIEEKFNLEEDILQALSYLNYEVPLEPNVPQIIGIYYFDDSNSLAQEVALYEDNKIQNIQNYKYLYVMKIVFE